MSGRWHPLSVLYLRDEPLPVLAARPKWRKGELGDAEFEDDFIDFVICDDIGEGADGWDSPGGTYRIG